MATAQHAALQRAIGPLYGLAALSEEIDRRVSGNRIALAYSAAPALDGSVTGTTWDVRLTGAFAPTLINAGDNFSYALWVQQDGTGSRIVTWPAGWKWAAGTPLVLSTSAGSVDLVLLLVRGTTVYARSTKGFA